MRCLLLFALSACGGLRCPEITHRYKYGQQVTITEGFWGNQEATIILPKEYYRSKTCNEPGYLVELRHDKTMKVVLPESTLKPLRY